MSNIIPNIDDTYKYGFSTDIDQEDFPKGLDEEIVKLISAKMNEPSWMLEKRLEAFKIWKTMKEPVWALVSYPKIDYQDSYYYSSPKKKDKNAPMTWEDVDPKIKETYARLGIPLHEQEILAGVQKPKIAVDAVFDSISVATTYKEELKKHGIIFCPISEAIKNHGDLVKQYFCSVVPNDDNFFAALNTAVFTDGTFVFVPKGVKCPMELSSYFRINAKNTGQFERTLIVAEEGASLSYLEGCTAPKRDENQLHAAVVELIALDDSSIKYSTVQNWYPGDKEGKGGIYNFVTKRGICKGKNSKISWTQVETGSAITWKYPSCILMGDDSIGEFYSVAVTNNYQQADTGTKMIHIGKNTKSTIIAKSISAGHSKSTYRGLVKVTKSAKNAKNRTQCDNLLIGSNSCANTIPYIESRNPCSLLEHEASVSKISDEQLFYCKQRGISNDEAMSLIVNGFCKEVLQEIPMEFAVEAQKLIGLSIEGN